MDLGAFVQENKRWLGGCTAGAIVWLIASSIVNSVFDPGAVAVSPNKLGAPTTKVFDQASLERARQEQAALATERQRLEQELAFVPSARFQLAGKGEPGDYLFQMGRALKQAIATAANDRDVVVNDTGIAWEIPTGVDEIGATLFGLELLDEVQQRLFAAHDAERAATPDAIGLRGLSQLKLDARRNQRVQKRTPRPGEFVVGDLVLQEQVSLHFQADEATVLRFVESCRVPGRTLVLDGWQLQKPVRPGEPCAIKAVLQGIAFRAPKTEEK
jgi:hypothetical protein